jgi:hypothetical protein
MALSNREKQARWRERMRGRGAIIEEMMRRTRKDVREWQRFLAVLATGISRFYTNNVDTTADVIAQTESRIRENTRLLLQYDPEDLTHDGEVEIGDISPTAPQELWRGRAVSYALDDEGRACRVRAYDSISIAKTDAVQPGRFSGVIGDEAWSVRPFEDSQITSDPLAG